MPSRSPGSRLATALQGSPEPISALNRVRILELVLPWVEREPLVDIRDHCPAVLFAENVCPYLRTTTADMLNVAAAALPSRFRFRIGTALRTFAMQKSGWDRYFERMRQEHPEWPLSALRRATNKYHAPYDQKAPPGHCTGGAVDVVLVDPDNLPIDVTSPTLGWDAAYTWSDRIDPEPRANRMAMVEAMLSAGFSNCRDEYWHYSWGDSAWAVRVGSVDCPYGIAYPPVRLETDFPGASAGEVSVQEERDWSGRLTRASGVVTPERDGAGGPHWSVGLYWAREVPVEIRVAAAEGLSSVYAGPSMDKLELCSVGVERSGELLVRLTPQTDRVFLASKPPDPVEDADGSKSVVPSIQAARARACPGYRQMERPAP